MAETDFGVDPTIDDPLVARVLEQVQIAINDTNIIVFLTER